ncbi:MAG: 50S ribosomal protein L1 [Gammaproteobacteria bacterium]|jgi:large subunit ribosomal protein L1|nr:MAG: 50S ribosomal protein L1 [Gammaproteobacteria bacterium]|tara:strand:+ start:104 stop:751 length:648 start_codon:yes stop_codon:yes gene_type:complete
MIEKVKLEKALSEINENASKNFKEALDVAVNLGIDPKKTDQAVRGATNLPHGNGKTYKVAVFAEGDEAKDALDNGADKVGMEDLAEDMKKGDLNYDVIIATPATMKVVSPLGQILGPKGLMPNPKSETVTKDVKTAVKNAKAGQIRYKSDKQGIIHTRIGQVGYSEEQLRDNLEAFLTDLKKAKPPSSKGVFISKVSISSTMGEGFDIDLTTLNF